MATKLDKLRAICTPKQVAFVDLIKSGKSREDAYVQAGYKAVSKKIAQQCACKLLTSNSRTVAYYEALMAEDRRKTGITRTLQLNRLDFLYDLAVEQGNTVAAKGVIAEQNEMLGYHREAAPNLEAEAAWKQRLDEETQALREQAKERIRIISIKDAG